MVTHGRDTRMVNINYRLSDEKVQASKIEVSAVVHSLIECMKYVLSRYNSDGNTDCHVGEDILQEKVKNHTLVLQCGHKLNFSFHMRKSVSLFTVTSIIGGFICRRSKISEHLPSVLIGSRPAALPTCT